MTSTGNENDLTILNPPSPLGCNIVGVDGDVIAAGGFVGTATLGGGSLASAGGSDVLIARFRGNDGGHVWSMRYGGTSGERAYAIATDGTRVFVGGLFSGTTNLGGSDLAATGAYDAFVAAYSVATGTPVWSQHFGSMGGIVADEAVSIAASSGQLATTLRFGGTLQIGAQSFTTLNGSPDIAIMRLDQANGEPIRAWQFGSTGYDHMSVTYAGPQLVGNGTFAGTVNLFGTPLSSAGYEDIAAFRVDLDRAK